MMWFLIGLVAGACLNVASFIAMPDASLWRRTAVVLLVWIAMYVTVVGAISLLR